MKIQENTTSDPVQYICICNKLTRGPTSCTTFIPNIFQYVECVTQNEVNEFLIP